MSRQLCNLHKLQCHKCARCDFASSHGLTQHISSCKGLLHFDRSNLSRNRPWFSNPNETAGAMRVEDSLLLNAIHHDGSELISFTHKKKKNNYPSKYAKKAHKKDMGDSASSSSSDSDSSDDDDFPANNNYFCPLTQIVM